jgi:hypothetical protein
MIQYLWYQKVVCSIDPVHPGSIAKGPIYMLISPYLNILALFFTGIRCIPDEFESTGADTAFSCSLVQVLDRPST